MSSLTQEQLPEICQRLEKEVERAKSREDRNKPIKLKNFPDITDWRKARPFLKKDFVDQQIFPSISVPLETVPRESQEFKLIMDLFKCFLGGNATFINSTPLTHNSAVRTFKVHPQFNVDMRDLAEKCLMLATYYSQICRFIEDNRLLSVGRVNQALTASLDETLLDYKNFICKLEMEHNFHKLSLQEVWFQVQNPMRTLKVIDSVVQHICDNKLRGAKTLSYLHELSSYTVDPVSQKNLFRYLTKKATIPYMKSVEQWVFNGTIFDPFDEFMILEKPKNAIKENQCLEVRDKKYSLRHFHVPSFLQPVGKEILKSGVYLNIIRDSCVSYHSNGLKLAPVEPLKYSSKNTRYIDVIKKAYDYSSNYLLTHMMNEYHIMDRFLFMRNYFLSSQGDFFVQIMDTCEEELSKPILQVVPSRLETLVDMAIRGFEGSIRNDFTISLKPNDLAYQVSKILSISVKTNKKSQGPSSVNTQLTGFQTFTLNMNCHWPVSLIFNTRVISCYQMLFRHLFYCKFIEKLLFRAWSFDQNMRQFPSDILRKYSSTFALRHKMIYFTRNMQYYMLTEAIEPNWLEFQDEMKKVQSIDKLKEIHLKFVDNCMKDCLLTNTKLYPIFKGLLETCKEFAELIFQYEPHFQKATTNLNNVTFSNTVNMLDKDFHKQYLLLLRTVGSLELSHDITTKILEILHRANYNEYFSSMLKDNEDENEK